MKALILSSSTGGGHNAAGHAVQEALLRRGHEVAFVDMFSLSHSKIAAEVGPLYVETAMHCPTAFGALYQVGRFADLICGHIHHSPVRWACGFMRKQLSEYLDENQYDIIVTPHLYPAETITVMRRKGMRTPPCVVVCTDYTCIPFWEDTDCDAYILPHPDLAEEYARHGVPADRLVALSIPVHRSFAEHPGKVAARQKLEIIPDRRVSLVMGGSMGVSKTSRFVSKLAVTLVDPDYLIVICGDNASMQEKLKRQYAGRQDVRIIGHTDDVADYMAASDIVYTKPGGISSTEAAVTGVPLVHLSPIPGCETVNRKFFAARGMSVYARTNAGLIADGHRLLTDPEATVAMLASQAANIRPDAADRIVDLCERMATEREN